MAVKRIYKEIKGSNDRLIGIDIHYDDDQESMPISIFAHGYKGFKDFGAWSLIGDQMANNGIVFVRFNFSHNGVTNDNPMEFVDLVAFGENNYSKEVDDFNTVINYIYELAEHYPKWNRDKLNIIGHSRGGGMAIITASENKYVNSIICWAPINHSYKGMPVGTELEEWEKEGVRYIINGRTKQEMPHYYQFYKNLVDNVDRLDIEKSAKKIAFPWLIIHGDNDEAIAIDDAIQLNIYSSLSALEIIENGTHTFSISHPWKADSLTPEMQKVIDLSINFIK